jgi:nucleoid-associated protein YgaU
MAASDQQLEQFKQKYAAVLRTIEQQGVRLANLHVQDGKLFIKGTAPSADAKNKVWDQIKLVNPTHDDIIADIEAAPSAPGGGTQTSAPAAQTYTVQPGDTLSKIAKQFYGDLNAYMHIFDANRDKLKDPNQIKVGQVLTIPPK